MLIANRSFASILALATASFALGCTVKSTPTDTPVETTANSGATTSTTSAGVGGDDGAGGAGGTGGADTTSNATATTTSNATVGVGGAGGGAPACETETGDAQDCAGMSITVESGAQATCIENGEAPPGKEYCLAGYEKFTKTVASDIQSCLDGLGVQNACEFGKITKCFTDAYGAACTPDYVAAYCAQLAQDCGTDTLDVQGCEDQLSPLNVTTLNAVGTCMETVVSTCNADLAACLDKALNG